MTGCRHVQDRDLDLITCDVEYGGDKNARVDRDGFAGLEIDVEIGVTSLEIREDSNQPVSVVGGARDMMAAPEIDPFHVWQPLSKARFESCEGSF